MKKKICIPFFTLLLIILIAGCKETISLDEKNISNVDYRIFEVYSGHTDNGTYFNIYADSETKVMYLYMRAGYGAGLSIMEDAEGKPLLWKG